MLNTSRGALQHESYRNFSAWSSWPLIRALDERARGLGSILQLVLSKTFGKVVILCCLWPSNSNGYPVNRFQVVLQLLVAPGANLARGKVKYSGYRCMIFVRLKTHAL
jgi:hypothetical protein